MSDFDNEHSDYEQITMNGQPAHFFRSNTEEAQQLDLVRRGRDHGISDHRLCGAGRGA